MLTCTIDSIQVHVYIHVRILNNGPHPLWYSPFNVILCVCSTHNICKFQCSVNFTNYTIVHVHTHISVYIVHTGNHSKGLQYNAYSEHNTVCVGVIIHVVGV